MDLTLIVPLSGKSSVVIILKSVVLPAPSGPINPKIQWAGISKLMSLMA